MLMQAFWAYEEVYHYHNDGVIEEWAWLHARAPIDNMMRGPGFQEWWERRCDWFGSEFCAFLNSRMPEPTGNLAADFASASRGEP